MKKVTAIILSILFILAFAGCSEDVEHVDISNAVQHSLQDGKMTLNGFEGNHKNISIPGSVNGTSVDILSPSFADGKTVESVELPKQISAFVRLDDGLALCTSSVSDSVSLNKGNAAAVFCEFFNTDSVTVNGVVYSKPAAPDLSGEWKNVDIINGVRYTQVYTFANGKVTCTSDSEAFEGTYEIKDGKLLVTIEDDVAEFEFMGEELICWEYDIVLSTKDAEDYAETSDTGWSYIVTPSGYAQLVGYHGTETNVTIPQSIDGYVVGSINSRVADTYNFTSISYSGEGGAPFIADYNSLYYDAINGNYILYNWNSGAKDSIPLRQYSAIDGGWDITSEAYCRFFKQSKITIDGKEYTGSSANMIAESDVVACWQPIPMAGYGSMLLSLYENGVAELHYFQSDDSDNCSKCRLGRYSIEGHQVIVTFDDGSLMLEYFDTVCFSWGENELLSAITSDTAALDFTKIPGSPYVHISAGSLNGRYTTTFDNYVDIKGDGTAVVTIAHMGWKDSVVNYSFENEILTLTDGTQSETMTLGKGKQCFVDLLGRYYYPESE